MHWTPADARELLSAHLLKDFLLQEMVAANIEFPSGIDEDEKMLYLVHCCYPNKVPYDRRRLTIKNYEKILKDKCEKWQKKYFAGKDGMARSLFCMQHCINKYLSFYSIRQLYELFGNPAEGNKVLNRYKLKKVCDELYDKPIDYLHYSLPESQRDYFYYYYYKFQEQYSAIRVTSKMKSKEVT